MFLKAQRKLCVYWDKYKIQTSIIMLKTNLSMVVVQVKNKDMNPTQNIRLQESTLLHLQSQGDKSEKCLTKSHVGVSAPQYDKHGTVQMFKKQNKRAYRLHHCLVVCFWIFFLVVKKQSYQKQTSKAACTTMSNILKKKKKKVVNGTSSRHLALVAGLISPLRSAAWFSVRLRDQEEVGLPASLLSLTWCCNTISLATQVIWPLVTAPWTPAFCCASSVSGVIPGCFPKKKLDHQWPESCLGSPGWWGMTSPLYSELPQELLLDVEPMRLR